MKSRHWAKSGTVAALAAAMLATLAPTSAQASPSSASPVEVTLFGGEPGNVSNLNTDWFTKYVEKNFNMKLKFNLVPDADEVTKESLLLASGQYPNVIWSGYFTPTQAWQYGQEGVLIPLNSLIKKYAPNLWNLIQSSEAYRQDVTAPNGKIYALGGNSYCQHCIWTYKMYINLADLKKYGLSMPTTTAQFAHVLSVFKQHGLTPLSGSVSTGTGYAEDIVTYLMNAFIPYNGPYTLTTQYLDVNNNKQVVFAAAQPAWRQGLQYIYSLYRAGDFSESSLTQDGTAVEQLIQQGKVGAVPNGAIQTAIPQYTSDPSKYLQWWTVPALKGPTGARYASFTTGIGGLIFGITRSASHAQAIAVMKLVNLIFSPEGTQLALYGPEGKYWTMAPKGSVGLGGAQAVYDTQQAPFDQGNAQQNWGWFQWGMTNEGKIWDYDQIAPPPFTANGVRTANELSALVAQAGHQPRYEYPTAVWVSPKQAQQYSTLSTNINDYVAQWTDEFITGQKSLTSDWDTYLSGLKSLGLARFLDLSKRYMVQPIDTRVAAYSPQPNVVKGYLSEATVPALDKTYLLQSGVPASFFKS